MATHSTIALEYADGTVDVIFCNWDGYPEYNGVILQEHYLDPFKVQQLMDLGNLSVLGANIGEEHHFDEPDGATTLAETRCTFFGRDRKEQYAEARRYDNFKEYLATAKLEEYNYILRERRNKPVWFVSNYYDGNEFKPLKDLLPKNNEKAMVDLPFV